MEYATPAVSPVPPGDPFASVAEFHERLTAAADLALEQVLGEVAAIARRVTGAEGAAVARAEPESVHYLHAAGSLAPLVGSRLPRDASLSGESLRLRRAVICTDSATDERVHAPTLERLQWRSAVCVPLEYGVTGAGVLIVCADEPSRFDERTVTLLRLIAVGLGARISRERERARSEQSLAERDQLIRSFVYESTLMKAVVEWTGGEDFRFLMVNPATAQLYGLQPSQMEGRTAVELGLKPEVLRDWRGRIARLYASAGPLREEFTRGGRHFTTLVVPLSEGPGGTRRFCFTTQDITDERQMRDQILVAERRALAGRVASGVAHEIKNPLAFATANLNYAREAFSSGTEEERAEALEALAEASEGLSRIDRLLEGLLSLSRGRPGENKVFELRGALEKALALAHADIRSVAELEVDAPEQIEVFANPFELEQVLLNLLVNASDAMRTVKERKHSLRVSCRREGDQAQVEVTDTGVGIAPDDLPHVFDAFFTTKGEHGTGLGLAIARDALRAVGGQISATSAAGAGATFRITLPCTEEAAAHTLSTASG